MKVNVIWQQTNKQTSKAYHLMIISWSYVDYLAINKWTNKHLMVTCWLSDNKETKLIIWWLYAISHQTNKLTNKQTNKQTNKAYHLVIIYRSFDDNLLIIWPQTNKQKKAKMWWASVDHVIFICWWMNKQTNNTKTTKTKLIIWWSFDNHLLSDTKQTNKQR